MEGIRYWLASPVVTPVFDDRVGDPFVKVDLAGRSLALVQLAFWGKEISSRDPQVSIFLLNPNALVPPRRQIEDALRREGGQVAIIGSRGTIADITQGIHLSHMKIAQFPLYQENQPTAEVFLVAPVFHHKVCFLHLSPRGREGGRRGSWV